MVKEFWRKAASHVVPLFSTEWSFCCVHRSSDSRCFSVDRITSKNCLFLWGNLDPPSNTCFLGPIRVSHQTASRYGSAVFGDQHIDRQTDRQTTLRAISVAIGRILFTACKQCDPKSVCGQNVRTTLNVCSRQLDNLTVDKQSALMGAGCHNGQTLSVYGELRRVAAFFVNFARLFWSPLTSQQPIPAVLDPVA